MGLEAVRIGGTTVRNEAVRNAERGAFAVMTKEGTMRIAGVYTDD
jgi:hypothetical protein